MITLLVILGAAQLIGLGFFMMSVSRARFGYESDTGFHAGPEPIADVEDLNLHPAMANNEDLRHAA